MVSEFINIFSFKFEQSFFILSTIILSKYLNWLMTDLVPVNYLNYGDGFGSLGSLNF